MSMEIFLKQIDPLLTIAFRGHDLCADLLGRWYVPVKRIILVTAHLSLLILLVPELAVFRKGAGELAANLLIALLFLSPLATIFRMRLLSLGMGLRREIGILMGYLAVVHGIGYMSDPQFFALFIEGHLGSDFLSMDTSILAGIIGLLLTLPLLITSNAFSTRQLGGKVWKRLHRLVYPAFLFIVLHRFFRVGGSWQQIGPLVEAGILIGAYAWLKYLAWKPVAWPWLRQIISLIGMRYTAYRQMLTAMRSSVQI